MTNYNNIQTPCFGTIKEIHAVLIKELNWLGEQVTINGWGNTVASEGFVSNESGVLRTPNQVAIVHHGTAILIGMKNIPRTWNVATMTMSNDDSEIFEIVTSGKVPHISKRCALCGEQLDQEGIEHGACTACYAEECGH